MPDDQELFDFAKSTCELSLGRGTLRDEKDRSVEVPAAPITVEELVKCSKRLRRSVEMWNKENGRQGYLNFIVDFFEQGEAFSSRGKIFAFPIFSSQGCMMFNFKVFAAEFIGAALAV